MSYRSITYHPKEEMIRLYTWDENGNRITVDHTFHPYLYVEVPASRQGTAVSIFKTPLKKLTFKTQYDRSKFIKDNGITRVFENLPYTQQFLIDRFWQVNETADFSKHPIKMVLLDIETYSPDGFPDIARANHPINVITIYDSITKKFITWGLKPYTSVMEDHTYVYCETEHQLLDTFLGYIESDYPDILSGWNSEFFDLPYIINRCKNILGEDGAKRLSPVKNVYSRDILGKFGRPQTRWYVDGVSLLDYLDIYKRFSPERESYKLDYIGEVEEVGSKIKFENTDLVGLADKDWGKFVEYNVQDVRLLVKLEEKLQYLGLVRMLAYVGLTTFEAAMGSLSVINGAMAVRSRFRNQIIPTFIRNDPDNTNPGAYVAEPKQGFQKYIFSFDATSLYPSVMISLNLSPETKIGKITNVEDNKYTIQLTNGKSKTVTKPIYEKFLKDHEIAITKANVLFTQKEKGIVPEIVDYYFAKRNEFKKEYISRKKYLATLDPTHPEYKAVSAEVQRLGTKQLTVKIFINSVYGYFGNKQAPIGDDDIASSITLTGQAVIKQSNHIITDFISQKTGIPITDLEKDTPVIYNDTDSSYISIRHLVDKLKIPFTDKTGNVSKDVYEIETELVSFLNKQIKTWGLSELNSKDCRFSFKRECIGDVGVFLQKKRYVLHVLDEEGVKKAKTKYVGVEVVRTSIPTALKPLLKDIIEIMLSTQDYNKTNTALKRIYDTFKTLPIESVATVMGMKNYEKYAAQCDGFTTCKGMPIHCKAAYFYNKIIQRDKLDKVYEGISSGDKVRFFYVQKPNQFGVDAIAFKYSWPKELSKYFKLDYDKVFEKAVFAPIERMYTAVGWRAYVPNKAVQTDLFSLLS